VSAVASAPSEPRPVFGRLDRAGRLISADAALESLQREAGSTLGQPLALPQIAAVAELARKLRTPVSRPALAASTDHDIELWVNATPEGDEIALSLEGWTERAPAGPRLAAILGGGAEAETGGARNEWAADEELRIISLSPDLAELLGVDPDSVAGQPLTRVVRLEEDDSGEMPLISARLGSIEWRTAGTCTDAHRGLRPRAGRTAALAARPNHRERRADRRACRRAVAERLCRLWQ
jgi:PAS domain-containing protein